MKEEQNYWTTLLARRLSRRRALQAGIGLGGAALVGCAAAPAATPTPTKAPPTAPTPSPRPAASPTPVAKQLDKLVAAFVRDLATLDPAVSARQSEAMGFFPNLFDALVIMNRDMKPSPNLALSWENPDDTTFLFKLRPGVKFHNGEDLDATVVVAHIGRIRDPKTKSGITQLISSLKSEEAVDSQTLRLVAKAPDPLLVRTLSDIYITPKKYSQESPDLLNTKPVGSGPYKFVKWVKDEAIELEALPSHFRMGAPRVKTFVESVVPAAAGRVAAFTTGAADVIYNIPYEDIPRIKQNPDLEVKFVQSTSNPAIMMSMFKEGPLQDKRVRQAMNYAVDKGAITKDLLQGYSKPMPVVVNSICFGYDATIKPYPYDPKKAKELLAAAGYANGFEVNFYLPDSTYPKYREYNQAVANYLGEIGIKASIRPVPGTHSAFVRDLREKDQGPDGLVHYSASCGAEVDAYGVLVNYEEWDAKSRLGNGMYWSNPELDKALKDARATLDEKRRTELYSKALRIIYDEAYAIFLFDIPDIWGYNKKKLKAIYPRTSRLHAWDVEPA
ncbi:MAG: hypothetical protein HYU86_12010 [Chloroflexi bacterium]|nr:hypothetical protein [Chloroflexota bacterium]